MCIHKTGTDDATERFNLVIKEKLPQNVRFEFFGITGKVYTIESSSDMKSWSQVPFAVGTPAVGEPAYRATGVGIVSAFTAPRIGSTDFFRLSVR